MDGLVTIRQHYRGVRPVKSYLRRKQFYGMKYLKTHPVWESHRNPEERKKFTGLLHVILDTSGKGVGIEREYGVPSFKDVKKPQVFQKAKPYTRTRRGKFEHVKGYGTQKSKEGELVFQVDAEVGKTPQKVAERFARTHWDKPREVEGDVSSDGTFSLVDGKATYKVRLKPGKRFESIDIFEVERLEKAKPYTRTRRGKFEHVKGSQSKEPSVVMEKLKANPSLAEYIVKRPQSHSPELVAMAKKVLGREIHGKTY